MLNCPVPEHIQGHAKSTLVFLTDFLEPGIEPVVKVFRYSFSEAIPIFFNRFKNDFILVDRYKIFINDWL